MRLFAPLLLLLASTVVSAETTYTLFPMMGSEVFGELTVGELEVGAAVQLAVGPLNGQVVYRGTVTGLERAVEVKLLSPEGGQVAAFDTLKFKRFPSNRLRARLLLKGTQIERLHGDPSWDVAALAALGEPKLHEALCQTRREHVQGHIDSGHPLRLARAIAALERHGQRLAALAGPSQGVAGALGLTADSETPLGRELTENHSLLVRCHSLRDELMKRLEAK